MFRPCILALLSLLLNFIPTWAKNFTNPVFYADYPDNDISLGPDGAYYYSASNFHYSPGAPILRSWDLVNWEPVGHSIPRLDFGDGYDLPATGQRAYRYGTWASTLRYRKSNKTWYWMGCTNFWNNWVFTAASAEGPWSYAAYLGGGDCYYDSGLLIDDKDDMYIVYGNGQIKVAQLAADGLSQVKTQPVFKASDAGVEYMEGSRMYQINGTYYILNDQPGSTAFVWKSESPWGPYEHKVLVKDVTSPVAAGSSPHQGSLIQTADGAWYFMSFTWAYPSGRMPVLAPIKWEADGFPSFVKGDNGGWGKSYPLPLPAKAVKPLTGTYRFEGPALGPTFEWNHNPDTSKFSVNKGLVLQTASVTTDLYSARNTLTHRIFGEFPVGTVEIDFTSMADGDRSGFGAFRDRSAYIGIHREGNNYSIVAAHNMTQDEYSGETLDFGRVVESVPVREGVRKIWFRAELDARAIGSRDANFSYSYDGRKFVRLGETYELYTGWAFFLGYRFAFINYATKALGGSVKITTFTSS
ncbi:glycosyl hydrolase family 43 protein [Paraphoma chrysanthemicola]|uniref:Glycosyl hydrolase family 43 protein n=1 Tax=Paraphoma chrysanthemicola TaxID=798071 RepID=A0A8K0QZH8_9PLEO|nr:glycosyl hydrolase family 43 protein [Paraphoma chrysanthemicola]